MKQDIPSKTMVRESLSTALAIAEIEAVTATTVHGARYWCDVASGLEMCLNDVSKGPDA